MIDILHFPVKLPSDECYHTLPIPNQHWCAIRQQPMLTMFYDTIWTGHNKLTLTLGHMSLTHTFMFWQQNIQGKVNNLQANSRSNSQGNLTVIPGYALAWRMQWNKPQWKWGCLCLLWKWEHEMQRIISWNVKPCISNGLLWHWAADMTRYHCNSS